MALSRKDIQRLGWTVGAVLISLLGGLAIASAADSATQTVKPAAEKTVKAVKAEKVETTTEAAPVKETAAKPAAETVSKALLAGAEYVGAETCLGCHDEQGGTFKNSIHARMMPGRKNLPFEKSCETCHGPGSLHAEAAGDKTNPGFATIKKPTELPAQEANATCLSCHKGGMQMHWKGSPHDLKDVSCVSCHSIHQTEKGAKKSLLKEEDPALCFTCHKEKKAQMKRSGHMPVKEGTISCTSCHNPHGTSQEHNLKGNSVTENCYSCHAEKRGPFLWDHPPVRENFLNCHDPHGNHNNKMLTAKQPYLCQRCHNAARHPATNYAGGLAGQLVTNSAKTFARSCVNCHSQIHGSNHVSGQFFTR